MDSQSKWIYNGFFKKYLECDRCAYRTFKIEYKKTCPNCGAKMKQG